LIKFVLKGDQYRSEFSSKNKIDEIISNYFLEFFLDEVYSPNELLDEMYTLGNVRNANMEFF
jgi:hypothetical protein